MLTILLLAATLTTSHFTLDSIDVEGTRIRPAIIRSETRLVAGREYATEDIEQAVYRVRRLPFVVGATYRLEPGNTAASRKLVIAIVDESRVNLRIDGEADQLAGTSSGHGSAWGLATAGFRFFTGSNGVVDAIGGYSSMGGGGNVILPRNLIALGPHSIGATYTAYGLFGTSAFAQASLTKTWYSSTDHTSSDPAPSILVGIPLTRTQTLTASGSRLGLKFHENLKDFSFSSPTVRWSADLTWALETIDDPYFTQRGIQLTAGPWLADTSGTSTSITGLPDNPVARQTHVSTRETGFSLNGAKYWPLRETMATFVRGAATTDRIRNTYSAGSSTTLSARGERLLFGIAFNTGQPLWVEDMTRHHFELGVGFGEGRNDEFNGVRRSSGAEGMLMWVYRTRRGSIRVTFAVVHQ